MNYLKEIQNNIDEYHQSFRHFKQMVKRLSQVHKKNAQEVENIAQSKIKAGQHMLNTFNFKMQEYLHCYSQQSLNISIYLSEVHRDLKLGGKQFMKQKQTNEHLLQPFLKKQDQISRDSQELVKQFEQYQDKILKMGVDEISRIKNKEQKQDMIRQKICSLQSQGEENKEYLQQKILKVEQETRNMIQSNIRLIVAALDGFIDQQDKYQKQIQTNTDKYLRVRDVGKLNICNIDKVDRSVVGISNKNNNGVNSQRSIARYQSSISLIEPQMVDDQSSKYMNQTLKSIHSSLNQSARLQNTYSLNQPTIDYSLSKAAQFDQNELIKNQINSLLEQQSDGKYLKMVNSIDNYDQNRSMMDLQFGIDESVRTGKIYKSNV